MAKTPAQRKAEETQRKTDQGLFRRSFWLHENTISMLESYRQKYGLATRDEAIRHMIESTNNPDNIPQ